MRAMSSTLTVFGTIQEEIGPANLPVLPEGHWADMVDDWLFHAYLVANAPLG